MSDPAEPLTPVQVQMYAVQAKGEVYKVIGGQYVSVKNIIAVLHAAMMFVGKFRSLKDGGQRKQVVLAVVESIVNEDGHVSAGEEIALRALSHGYDFLIDQLYALSPYLYKTRKRCLAACK